ncbi:hypothetical protein [Haloplanus natans]|uniref:hypothetical protein n=1 Tax=Haloplanus natans TaxID=376171 RepID=UPI0006776955|nr:hypothetical protein [Haloplanus natans]
MLTTRDTGTGVDLDPLTEPRHERPDPAYLIPGQKSLVESLRNRPRARRAAYVERSSESEWRLAHWRV